MGDQRGPSCELDTVGFWSVAGPPTILSEARRLDAGPRRALGAPRPKDVASVTEKGLREVVAADTTVSDIDGEEGRLWYVGYEIADLAEHATFEEVVYLLHHDRLPNQDELDELDEFLGREPRAEPVPHAADVDAGPAGLADVDAAHLDLGGVGLRPRRLGRLARGPVPQGDAADREDPGAHRLLRAHATGRELVPPNPKLPHAANFLYMLSGEEPDHDDADALDTTFILYADHTMNASTFTARIIASTLSDMFSAITGAIGALKGPLHGGANEEADEDGPGDRRARERRGVRARAPRAAREGHGVRPRRLPHDGPARDRAEAARARGGRRATATSGGPTSSRRCRRRSTSRSSSGPTSTCTPPACTTRSASRPT